MEEDKRGKSLAFWLVLFFLIVILLGAFVGKRLVQVVRASIDQDANTAALNNIDQESSDKALHSVEVFDQVTPLEFKGGYSFPSPTPTQPPTKTETLPPTKTETPTPTKTEAPPPTNTETTVPTKTETAIPTNTPTRTFFILVGETETPTIAPTETSTSTTVASPTPTKTRTPSAPPTVGPEGNPGTYIGAGMVLGLIGLVCFCLYFWNLVQVRRER